MLIKRLTSLVGIAITSLAIGAVVDGPKQPVGEIQNPSIEILDSNHQPLNWTMEPAARANTNPNAQVSLDLAHTGTHSLLISAGGVSWLNKVLLKPYATYKLTGWIKTQNVPATSESGARFELRGVKVTSPSKKISGTQDWSRAEIAFDTEGEDSAIIVATLGARAPRTNSGTDAPIDAGKAWFDDMKLELLSARVLAPTITIDVAKTREPMPDLIYGQFIEHLGRSIYGGIWAEMLEDRKFYSAVGETRRDKIYVPSPWKALGDPAAVMMTKENVFVGEHTPQVDLSEGGAARGITQSGLGVVSGKGYEGYVILAGDPSAAPIEVTLSWGTGASDRQTVQIEDLTAEYKKYPVKFVARASSDSATFEVTGKGKGKFLIGTSSLMPDDNVNGMRKDTLAQLKLLDAPIYRWPGGNFVSGYDWKDGIGDRDKRPPRKNPAWTGIEHNDFGLREFFEFCKELNTQPFIALNAGLGSVDSAVQEVQYVNGGPETPMGILRAKNGHPKPLHATYWAVGNEMSGSWQLGNVPIEEFVKRHNAFSQALFNIDKSIKLVASGDAVRPSSNWDRQLLSNSSDYINLISKHFYRQDWHGGGLMTHTRQIGDAIHDIAEAHRNYLQTLPEMKGKNIRISLDEWNYWYGPHVFGELGTRYFLRDALGIAGGINEFSRDSDVIALACYAQTVNVIGAIKTSKTAAVLDSTGEVLAMYRHHFGSIPVEITGASEPLDVAVAWTKDKSALTISIINPTYETQHLALNVLGARLDSTGRSWVLSGPDDMSYNDPGKDPVVKFVEKPVSNIGNTLEVAPVTATIFEIKIK